MQNILAKVFLFDLQRRAAIVHEEIEYLLGILVSKYPKSKQDQTLGSTAAHFRRLHSSAEQLREEILLDCEEIAQFKKYWEKLSDINNFTKTPYHFEFFRIIWHQKISAKFTIFIERMKELHDRVDQQLHRTKHENSGHVLRRRSEQGQTDRYLNENVKWIYRDFVFLAKKHNAIYPYDEVPSVFQTWQYRETSSNSTFSTYAEYLRLIKKSDTDNTTIGKPRKFVTIGMSYWMHECITLQPILGHELAHQILNDIYGRNEPQENKIRRSDLEDTIFLLLYSSKIIIERSSNDTIDHWDLVQEVICDSYAAFRFGAAYLYAWLLEMANDEIFVNVLKDQHGLLKAFANINFDRLLTEEWINRNIINPVAIDKENAGLPEMYIRGHVLIKLLSKLDRENDLATKNIIEDAEKFLENYLDLWVGTHSGKDSYYSIRKKKLFIAIAEDFSDIIINSKNNNKSDFFKKARDIWKFKNENSNSTIDDFSLRKQILSDPIRKKYQNLFNNKLNPEKSIFFTADDTKKLHTLNDAAWRVEWYSRSMPEDKIPFNYIRGLNFVSIDDYLYRTGNPHRLIERLISIFPECNEIGLNKIFSENEIREWSSSSNTVNLHKLKMMYEPNWLDKLNLAICSANTAEHPLSTYPIEIASNKFLPLSLKSLATCGEIKLASQHFDNILNIIDLNLLILANSNPSIPNTINTLTQENIYEKYFPLNDFKPVELLGKYDYMTLATMGKSTSIATSIEKFSSILFCHNDDDINVIARSKKIFPLIQASIKNKTAICTILVSLIWDAARLMMASKLKDLLTEIIPADHFDVYLSDGWEDIVCIIYIDELAINNEDINSIISSSLNFINEMNKNPFVLSTDTVFSDSALLSSALNFMFTCHRGNVSMVQLIPQLNNICKDHKLKLENIAGSKDFHLRLTLSNLQNRKDAYYALHELSKSLPISIETCVSW